MDPCAQGLRVHLQWSARAEGQRHALTRTGRTPRPCGRPLRGAAKRRDATRARRAVTACGSPHTARTHRPTWTAPSASFKSSPPPGCTKTAADGYSSSAWVTGIRPLRSPAYTTVYASLSIAAWGSTSSGSVTDQPRGAPPSIAARALVSLLCEGFGKTMTRRRARRWVGSAPREARARRGRRSG
jgi:hypothetical protein